MANKSGNSTLGMMLTVGSLGAGAYHGYMDASGNHLSDSLETTLTWAPAAAGAVTAGLGGLITGAAGGAAVGKVMADKGAMGAAAGGVGGAMIGTAWGGGYRGVQTLVGYGIGYMVGALLR